MARHFGLRVPETKTYKFSSKYHTFLTKRFDRQGIDKRLYFASAMTLLGYNDGDDAHDGASYLELAEFLQTMGHQD
jgi:serine/threonine-protein kinase HipA